MAFGKRKIEYAFDPEEDSFQVKKKYSFLSMETADSFSKEDPNFSPIVLKSFTSEPLMTPDHQSAAIREKLSALKLTSSHKKKHRSEHSSSSDEIKRKYMGEPSMYTDHFKAVKYKDYIYKLDSCMMIRNEADAYNDFICKLVRIIKPTKFDPKGILAFVEVQWYYKKDELPQKYAPILPHLSASEVFLSTHKDFIMIDCINGPGQILQYSEFDKLDIIPNNTYFTRANYDATRKKFDPPIEKWGQNCICKTPMNPDCNYIQCDKCDGWYHLDCVGITTEEATAIEQYFCYICRGDKPPLVPSLNLDLNKQEINLKRKKSHVKSNKKSIKVHKARVKPVSLEEIGSTMIEQKLQFNMTESCDDIFQSALYNKNNQEPLDFPKGLNFKKDTTSLESFGDLFSTTTHHEGTDQFKDESNQELPDEEERSERMDVESIEEIENQIAQQCAEQGFIFEFNLELREDVTKIFSEEYEQEDEKEEQNDPEENQEETIKDNLEDGVE